MTLTLTPPLKWAGGKSWLVPTLAALYAPYRDRTLVEPFCGGLSVTLSLVPARGVCNDALESLINFYEQIKIGLSVPAWPTDAETYYQKREAFNKCGDDDQEYARLFYYLNRVGFNGLCRFNARGLFNVPHGGPNRKFPARNFDAYKPLLRNVSFSYGDFAQVSITPEDFIYADPPYDTPFTTYSQGGFSWADQMRCAEWLAAHPGPVVASNQATDRIVELYTSLGFQIEIVNAPRRIACNGNRDDAREILATRNLER